MDHCKQSIWRLGAWVSRRWREQEGIDLEGTRDRAASDREEERYGDEAAQENTKGRILTQVVLL